jgi:hypothetical protein
MPKGALNVCEPPHELVNVNVPVVGGSVYEIEPVIVYELVVPLQAETVPVKPVKLHVGVIIEQSVAAVPLPENEILVAVLEKFVINRIYTSPTWAFAMLAVSVAAPEKLQSTTVFKLEPVVAVPKLLQ